MPSFLRVTRHLALILFIFFVSVLLRYPFLINSDHFFSADDGLMANTILRLLSGGPIAFYYDFVRYFGLTFGLTSVPFIWILGVKTLAYQLPGTLFYSLYVWTNFLLAKILTPRVAPLLLALMLITTPYITSMSIHNWPHIPAAFFGNVIFLLFIQAKLSKNNQEMVVFFLFLSMGLAIYTYTYSLIYISVIALLFLLSHPKWDQFREGISPSTLVSFLKKKGGSAQRICRFLDVLVFLFLGVIIFSYVFGGFAVDIGGVSIFQVKNFHKPAFQLVGILLLRIAIYRKDLVFFFNNIKSLIFEKVSARMWRLVSLGTFGFCLGLSPRIASILIGETSRGGQGFDTDILPTQLGMHFWDVISRSGPELFGLGEFQNLTAGFEFPYTIISWVLFFLMVALFLLSGFFFFFNNWISVKKILSLNATTFQAHHIFILLPILVCAANIIVENGSEPRYLFPLFGTVVLWIGWLLSKIQKKTKWFSVFILILWVVFYSTENYQSQKHQGLIDGVTPVKFKKHIFYDLIGFLESNSIHVAYSNYGVSQVGTYLSVGKINISEYTNNPWATTQKAMSMGSNDFAIIVTEDHDDDITYSDFLKVSNTQFKFNKIGPYKVFWDFLGDATEVNKLRSLVNG
jgi:hypothetical protein